MTSATGAELTIVRLLDAPRERVWRACKEPEALKRWWGQPKGAAMPFCSVDFRVGGCLHFQVALANGDSFWFKCVYLEIDEGERLVMEQHPSDQAGRELDSLRWPPSKITMRFEDSRGMTKLTIEHAGMASDTHPVEQYCEGWSQSLDRLVDGLAET